jgi:hypothetical protein
MTEERDLEKDEWLRHERTRYLRERLAKKRLVLLHQIIQTGESSEDVKVRTVVAEFRACSRTLAMLTHGNDWTGNGGPLPGLPDG